MKMKKLRALDESKLFQQLNKVPTDDPTCSGLQSKHVGPATEGVFDLQSTRPKTGIICN